MDLTAKIVIKNCWVRIPKAYSAVAGTFTGKLIFFKRTIPNLGNLLKPLEDMIHFTFISSITGGHICSHHDRIIPFPLARFGGLGIPKFHEIALDKPRNTWSLVYSVVSVFCHECILSWVYSVNDFQRKKLKNEIKTERERRCKNILTQLQKPDEWEWKTLEYHHTGKRSIKLASFMPISDQGFDLTKQQFWDSVRIRYGWELTNILSSCTCISQIDVHYDMSGRKGGFLSIRHNDSRDLTEIC